MRVLFSALAPASFYRFPLLPDSSQLFLGPDQLHDDSSLNAIGFNPLWLDGWHLVKKLQEVGFIPDITIIKADATRRNHFHNLHLLPGKKVLMMGDTHHLVQPLSLMIEYALSQKWDLVSSEHDRHHLPLFREAGLDNLIWLPCFTMNPFRIIPSIPTADQPLFVGSLSPHHIYRHRVIQGLKSRGVAINVLATSQASAASLYNKHQISVNVSLNGDFNFRIMETLAAGGCLLTDRLGPDSGLNLLFKEELHYLAYSSVDEAAAQIMALSANPARRMAIAQAGFERFWCSCSPHIQSQALLAALNNQAYPEIFQAPY